MSTPASPESGAFATLSDDTPLGEARRRLQDGALGGGTRCPCCGQRAQVYRRSINSSMAKSLIKMWMVQRDGADWIHVPTEIGARSREEGKLRYWGLVTERPVSREDGGHAGYWRVTTKGSDFVAGGLELPRYALVYDGNLLELTGPLVDIETCLGEPFDLTRLLGESA